jgi:acyl transferase domain-containing protein
MSATKVSDHRQLLEQAVIRLRDTRARLHAHEQAQHEPAAVLGASVRTPGGVENLDQLWQLLRDGVHAVGPLTLSEDGRRPARGKPDGAWAGLLDQIDAYDAEFFGISDAEAERLDPQQRLLAETVWEAMEDAGIPLAQLQAVPTGVFVGIYGTDYLQLQLADARSVNAYSAPGAAHSVAANRLSYLFDLHGPSLAVDTACSSSLAALHLAARSLRDGECELAIVAGVNVIVSPLSTILTGKVLPLSPRGRCHAFDADADGIVRAEGCGAVILQRQSGASLAGRRPRALIRGTAVNHNGRTNGLTAPSPRSQAELFRNALAQAKADPADVVYLEAHGTGTTLGDPIEMEAIREVYGAGERPCAIGSVKTNFGHQEAAAGIVGLLKAILVLEHGEVPPHLHLNRLNPEIDLTGSRLDIPTRSRPLPPGPRWAAVSSFGFGGANAHVVVCEPEPRDDAGEGERPRTPERAGGVPIVLPLSARGPAALRALAGRYAARLDSAADLADVAAATSMGRTPLPDRVCLVGSDGRDLVGRLRAIEVAADDDLARPALPGRGVAFVYSGQGCQWAGMGRELLAHEPVARTELEACDAVIRGLAGWSLLAELEATDSSRLSETEIAQPAIAAVQLALTRLWASWGIQPAALIGHSMGEIVATCVAGGIDRGTAMDLLLRRARCTEMGARGGRMHTVSLPADHVRRLIDRVGGKLGIAAVNSARATVVSGEAEAVAALVAAAEESGSAHRALPVDYAFHSPLLGRAAEHLATEMAGLTVRPLLVPLYSSVTGRRVTASDMNAQHWARNLREEVRFEAAVRALLQQDGVDAVVEVGPHPVLTRNVSETAELAGRSPLVMGSLRRGAGLVPLYRSLGSLWSAGWDVDWTAVNGRPPRRVNLPSYPWQRRRHWLPEQAGVPRLLPGEASVHASVPVVPARREPPDAVPPGQRDVLRYVQDKIAHAVGASSPLEVPADISLDSLALSSLTVVELKNQVHQELGVTVALKALLEARTPAELAAVIAAGDCVDDGARSVS